MLYFMTWEIVSSVSYRYKLIASLSELILFLKIQGRVIPCDFIGVVKSQQPVYLKGI